MSSWGDRRMKTIKEYITLFQPLDNIGWYQLLKKYHYCLDVDINTLSNKTQKRLCEDLIKIADLLEYNRIDKKHPISSEDLIAKTLKIDLQHLEATLYP
jgi:hypothetical protein